MQTMVDRLCTSSPDAFHPDVEAALHHYQQRGMEERELLLYADALRAHAHLTRYANDLTALSEKLIAVEGRLVSDFLDEYFEIPQPERALKVARIHIWYSKRSSFKTNERRTFREHARRVIELTTRKKKELVENPEQAHVYFQLMLELATITRDEYGNRTKTLKVVADEAPTYVRKRKHRAHIYLHLGTILLRQPGMARIKNRLRGQYWCIRGGLVWITALITRT